MSVRIVGTGACLPAGALASRVFDRRHGLADGTVQSALGVRTRRVAGPQQATSDLAVAAARNAFDAADGDGSQVDLVLLATSTPDHITPASAPLVAHQLGLTCAASDVANTCAGWVYALALADRWLCGGEGTQALVIGANVLSRRVDWAGDWRTAGLFGDGAGAVLLEARGASIGRPGGILATALSSDGGGYEKIQVAAGGSRTPLTPERFARREHLLGQAPKARLKESVSMLEGVARRALARAGLEAAAIDRFVPHQASAGLVWAAAAALGIPADRTECNVAEVGNTSAASIPIALDAAVRAGRIRSGDRLLLATVAAGMVAGAAVVEWEA